MSHTDLHAATEARVKARRQNPSTDQSKGTNQKGKGGEDKTAKVLRYPYAMLTNNTDYLKIQIAAYNPPQQNLGSALGDVIDKNRTENVPVPGDKKNNTKDINPLNEAFSLTTGSETNDFKNKTTKSIKSTIYLPIPQQLSSNTSVSWGDSTLSPLDAFGVAATAGILDNGSKGVSDAIEALKYTPDLFGNENLKKAVVTALSGEIVGQVGGNVSGAQLVSRATGQVFNPNLELLFEGVNLRTFPFSFELFPRNKKEGEEIMKIIRTLKTSMSARKKANKGQKGLFIGAPDVFQLTYMKGNDIHPFLNTFLPMALTSFNIVYTGSNTYSTFYDGTPTHMRMDLTFKELSPVYSEDYEGTIGVGY
jgi:hypothetical protein